MKTIARYIGQKANIQVVFEKDGQPRTNGKVIYLPSNYRAECKESILAACIHESFHVRDTDFSVSVTLPRNCIEDIRIDRRALQEIGNAPALYKRLIEHFSNLHGAESGNKMLDCLKATILNSYARQGIIELDSFLSDTGRDFVNYNPRRLASIIKSAWKSPNTRAGMKVSKRLLSLIHDFIRDTEFPDSQDQGQDSQDQGQDSQDGKTGNSAGNPGNARPGQALRKFRTSDAGTLESSPEIMGRLRELAAEAAKHPEKIDITGFKSLGDVVDHSPAAVALNHAGLKRLIETMDAREIYSESGSLNTRRIDRVFTDPETAFLETRHRPAPNSYISILLDSSGSMGYLPAPDSRASLAAAACNSIIQALDQLVSDNCKLRFSIWGFNIDGYKIKGLDACQVKISKSNYAPAGGTDPKMAWQQACAEIDQESTPESKKIIIIISDGLFDTDMIRHPLYGIPDDYQVVCIGIGNDAAEFNDGACVIDSAGALEYAIESAIESAL